ncbi:DUF3549 family protein [Marinomonas sp. THO17]|uniref:DUF3549 family protein n=1 Tax=Marinomonas sp. THO17 TaxID=3149048 RepID=UPI00336C0E92
MNKIESLSDLFNMVGCQVTYYDLGRCINRITPQQAIQFDRKQQAYPYPFRQHAWLACLLRNTQGERQEQNTEAVIWFLKLPLDEAGALNLGTRDHFIKSIVDKILHKGQEEGLSEALEDSPYAFKPDQERMASFHAILAKDLHQDTSRYFADVIQYLRGDIDSHSDSWQSLGLQGIAELAVRVDQPEEHQLALKALAKAPAPFVSALCHALEHQALPNEIRDSLLAKLGEEQDPMLRASYVRALSKGEFVEQLLLPLFGLLGDLSQCNDDDIHLIAALAAKCPHWIALNPQLLRIIMEKLAHRQDAFIAFKQITAEFSQHPETKQPLWQLLRSERISSQLAQAVGHLFAQTPKSVQ